jgi:S1-C subfamily serine protease
MPRRAQLILMPFLIVPLILLLILGSITFFRRDERDTTTRSNNVVVQPVATMVAQSTPAPVIGTTRPAPTVPASVRSSSDTEDALITALYHDRSPAVVSIRILGAPGTGGQLQLPRVTPEPGPDATPGGAPQAPEFGFQAEGSGFLIDGQGHIVTNNHVVENAKNIEVTFTDGSTVGAKVVGTDPDSDLAVIKVERIPDGVKPLELGDSKQVKVGQRAIAIGNPFGLDSTLTVGIISARGRTLRSGQPGAQGSQFSFADVLQTDAAINPGNSGGPLFNSAGEVIGVNQSIIPTDQGTFEGVGFAISSNTVKKVAAALISKGRYEHPYLGLSMAASITDRVAKELKLSTRHGVPVEEVVQGGPSDKAGIRGGTGHTQILGDPYPTGGDIVLKIDDKPVNSSADVIDYLATDTQVGQTVTLTILRAGKELKVPVVLAARPRPR